VRKVIQPAAYFPGQSNSHNCNLAIEPKMSLEDLLDLRDTMKLNYDVTVSKRKMFNSGLYYDAEINRKLDKVCILVTQKQS
jgi:hypothetical protein